MKVLMSGEVMPAEKVPELIAGITTADVQVRLNFYGTGLDKEIFHAITFRPPPRSYLQRN